MVTAEVEDSANEGDMSTVRNTDVESVPLRGILFEWTDDTRAAWHPAKPEFAAACNAVSLGMPYGEPYVIASVRAAIDDIDNTVAPHLADQARAYIAQERGHYRQHLRFNEIVTAQHPGLRRIERWLAISYRWLRRHRSRKFNLAFAAGFEAIAFAAARWIDSNRRELFTGADTLPATLMLWHLAEEVEHKNVAFDVWQHVDGNRLRYAAAMTTSFLMLTWFIFLGTVTQLWRTRRIFNPLAWIRLTSWGIRFTFEVLPTMLVTALPGHHPSDLADPTWMPMWLESYDPLSGTIPAWDAPIA